MRSENQKWPIFIALVVVAAAVWYAPFLVFMFAIIPAILFVGFLVLRKLAK